MASASADQPPASELPDSTPREREGAPPDSAAREPHEQAGGQHKRAEGRHERYGPLELERHAKDDGRALLIYARRECEDE